MKLTLLSLGAGVQSTVLALMAAAGEVDALDGAIFADTGWEPRRVYGHLDRLELELLAVGIPLYRVSAGNLRADAVDPAHRYASVPYYVRGADGSDGMGRRQCTHEYKLAPILRKVRELLGASAPNYRTVKRGNVAEQWIGFSTDEIGRVSDKKKDGVLYATKRYPLLELGMSRDDCDRWLKRRGWTSVAKSACIGCPYHGNRQWRDLRDNHPDEWADAVAFDAEIRRGGGSRIASQRGGVPTPVPRPAVHRTDRPGPGSPRLAGPADGHLRPARGPRRGRRPGRMQSIWMQKRPIGGGGSMTRALDLAGQTFNRLTVLSRAQTRGSGCHVYWECRCACGKTTTVRSSSLRRGAIGSCGCGHVTRGPSAVKRSPLYGTWRSMKSRCLNPNHDAWRDYGGRGIEVCAEWTESFEAFRDHMGMRPSSRHTIDRIDNDGNYEPGNVRWATPSEQRSNQRWPARAPRCRNGHLRAPDNTLVGADGVPRCRTCRRATQREYKARVALRMPVRGIGMTADRNPRPSMTHTNQESTC